MPSSWSFGPPAQEKEWSLERKLAAIAFMILCSFFLVAEPWTLVVGAILVVALILAGWRRWREDTKRRQVRDRIDVTPDDGFWEGPLGLSVYLRDEALPRAFRWLDEHDPERRPRR